MSHLSAVPDDEDAINEENPDWMDKIRMLMRDKQPPPQEAPSWVKELNYEWFTENIEALLKSVWHLGWLEGVKETFDIVNDEEVNIAMNCLKEWAENK